MCRVAGSFTLLEKKGQRLVVACIGSLWADQLTEQEIQYIAGFYNVKNYSCVKVMKDYECPHRSNYNDFLIVTC